MNKTVNQLTEESTLSLFDSIVAGIGNGLRQIKVGNLIDVFLSALPTKSVSVGSLSVSNTSQLGAASATSLNNTPVGNTTPSSASFTTLAATGQSTLAATSVTTFSATGQSSFADSQQTAVATTRQPAAATQNTTATLSLAQIQSRILTSAPAAAITLTFPDGATLDGFITGFANNTGFDFSIVNTSANAVTVAGNTGTVFTGNATVAATSSASFRFRRVTAGSYQVFRT